MKLLYAQGFRNPSPYEAFFADGQSFDRQPATLKPERIASYEAVLWGRPVPGLSLRLSGFLWDLEDLIELHRDRRRAAPVAERDDHPLARASRPRRRTATRAASTPSPAAPSRRRAQRLERDGAQRARVVVSGRRVEPPSLVRLVPRLDASSRSSAPRHTRDPMLDADAWVGWNVAVVVPERPRLRRHRSACATSSARASRSRRRTTTTAWAARCRSTSFPARAARSMRALGFSR